MSIALIRRPLLAVLALVTLGSGAACAYAPPPDTAAQASTSGGVPGMDMSASGSASSTMNPQAMDAAMQASIKAFPAKTAGLGA